MARFYSTFRISLLFCSSPDSVQLVQKTIVKEPRYSVCSEQQETHHTRDSLVVYVQHAGQYDSSSMVQCDRILYSHVPSKARMAWVLHVWH